MTFMAISSLAVEGISQPDIPSLAEYLAAATGDPLLLGATAYLDDVFTVRLMGGTV
jgi:hypothetical protein